MHPLPEFRVMLLHCGAGEYTEFLCSFWVPTESKQVYLPALTGLLQCYLLLIFGASLNVCFLISYLALSC